MGLNPKLLSEVFISRIASPEDQKHLRLIRSGAIPKVVQTEFLDLEEEELTEKQMHGKFIKWLRGRRIPYIEAAMHKETGIRPGHPDFTVMWNSLVFLVEMKMPGGRLSDMQKEVIDDHRRAGNKVVIAYSSAEAIQETKDFFQLQ